MPVGYSDQALSTKWGRVKRQFRLTRSTDFKRVRRYGKSYAHPFLVLVALRNESEGTRIGVTAGKSVGGSVQRNRAKRRIRAAVQPMHLQISAGWDVILIARPALLTADFPKLQSALKELLIKARLFGM